jgi:hypothetical protein
MHNVRLPAGVGNGVIAFLSHLGNLQHLTHLELHSMFVSRPWEPTHGRSAPTAVFTALTASSSLQHLELRDVWMPPGALQHVFPPGQQRPELRTVVLSECLLPQGVEADDVSTLVACCGNLQRFELLCCDTDPVAELPAELLRPLVRLSQQLTHLTLNYVVDSDVPQTLVQLTELRALEVATPNSLSELGLLQLTQLQQLTKLKVYLGAADDRKYKFRRQVSVWYTGGAVNRCGLAQNECGHSVSGYLSRI